MKPTSTTRRQFLRLTVLGMGAATLGACSQVTRTPIKSPEPVDPTATSTAAPTNTAAPTGTPTPEPARLPTLPPEPTASPVIEVVVTTSGWPLDAQIDAEFKDNPANKAQQDAIQVWLDQHPGVSFRRANVNIWDPQSIPAHVAAGTDCTYLFGPSVGGGWGREHAVQAFQQGLLADVTPFIKKYNLQDRILKHYWNNWSANSQVEDRFFSYPLNQIIPSAGTLVFRKDIIEDLDLEMPAFGWNWTAFAEALRAVSMPNITRPIYGLAAPPNFLSRFTSFFGAEVLTDLPAPNNKWHWKSDWSDPRWVEVIKTYRALLYKDKAILSNANIAGDTEVLNLFREGRSIFGLLGYWSMFGSPSDSNSLAAMADREGKKFSDIFSIVPVPTGDGYQEGNRAEWGPVSFSPNQTREQLDAGIGLLDWMFFGEGLDLSKLWLWETTQDPRSIFSAFLYMDGRERYEGITARPEDAWGEELIARWKGIAQLPVQPRKENYFPAEENRVPETQTIGDPLLLLISDAEEKKDKELVELLQKVETDWNRRVEMFDSSLSAADFRAGAVKYYAALDTYFQTYMPDFYLKRYLPFYEKKVWPVIGQGKS